jgi:hypothetical protein
LLMEWLDTCISTLVNMVGMTKTQTVSLHSEVLISKVFNLF